VMRKDGLTKREELEKKIKNLGVERFIIEEVNVPRFDLEIEDVDVLLVGLGAPYQEEFIWQIKSKMPNLKLAMGVGGTFDFWTGKQKRAPKFMRSIGMEWLWRLFRQPKRLGRIWKATVVFLWRGMT
jgi:exopolysaccharide biosynthesis WecB/TagA/CpsF family protein